jgi:hypothetical protein
VNINQRGTGNTNILKQIQEASKQVSHEMGLDKSMQIFKEQPKVDESKLGAAASMGFNNKVGIPDNTQQILQEMVNSGVKQTPQRQVSESPVSSTPVQSVGSIKFDFTRSYVDRLIDNVEMLSTTKEYFNTLQSMLSLYALGYLDESVLDKLTREDLKEIKGIVREFKSILDEY